MNLPLPIRVLLWPISLIYGIGARCRAFLYQKGLLKGKRLNTPVISVGNLTVGGTGKTPMVMYLAEKFLAEGKRVGILSRGYRGSGGTGDEVEMLKHRLKGRVEFGVGPDRYLEGSRIERENRVDVFLLDDGFQHLRLHRDVDIVLWDGSNKVRRQWLLPAGRLRESMSAIGRADILVITRKSGPPVVDGDCAGRELVVCAQTKLLGFRKRGDDHALLQTDSISRERLYAFCGLGNPLAFYADLERWQIEVTGECHFRDHHRYSAEDARQLTESAHWAEATGFITTEKDEQNLHGVDFGEWPIYVAVISLEVNPEEQFNAAIRKLLSERRGATV
jgi:tetraacyldisaccharide 4'-kinase